MNPKHLLSTFGAISLISSSFVHAVEPIIDQLGLDPIVSDVPVIGVVGDSLSDEYSTYPYGFYEANWTVLLEETEKGQLGDFQSLRMYPRLYGYEYNWARAGAETSHVLDEGQTIGLGLQILDHDVEVAVMLIGANDFGSAYDEIYHNEWSDAQIKKFMDDLKENLKKIVEDLRFADPAILVLCTIPDLGDTPNYRQGDHPDAEKRAIITALIEEANTYIIELAESNQAAVVDTFTWFKTIVENEAFRYMGYRMNSATGGYESYHAFTIDGFHPGTLLQSYLANMILTAIEDERVRLINLQIDDFQLTHPTFAAIERIKPNYRLIENNLIFPMLEIAPSADLFFPESRFTDASLNVIQSPWFGVLSIEHYPWINHAEHGWLYCEGYGGSVWVRMWDSHLGWLHTKPEAYPIFIQVSNGHALRYELGTKEPRRFFDLDTQSWIDVPYGAPILPTE